MPERRHPNSLSDLLLGNTSKLAKIQQKSGKLQEINQFVTQELVPGSNDFCRVANIRQGILVIEVASGAWATRLKANRLSMLERLRQQHLPALASIDIRVNPQLFLSHRPPPKPNPRHISSETASQLEQLAESAPKELAEILQRLARKARR